MPIAPGYIPKHTTRMRIAYDEFMSVKDAMRECANRLLEDVRDRDSKGGTTAAIYILDQMIGKAQSNVNVSGQVHVTTSSDLRGAAYLMDTILSKLTPEQRSALIAGDASVLGMIDGELQQLSEGQATDSAKQCDNDS